MSSVGSVGATGSAYQVNTQISLKTKPAQQASTKAAPASDPDHDGDSDKGGVDVKG